MILSCGEALIDMLPRTSTLGEPCFAPYAGGAVMNTAIALGRLGAPSGFFSGLSNDMLGEILTQTLEASKVDTSFCARSNRPTTVAFVKLVNGQATYAFYDENTAGVTLSQDQLPILPASIDTLFFGGISLVNDPAASTYAALQARESATLVTMIDPNIRLGFIAGKEVPYRARIEAMVARADIVKLSDEDLAWLKVLVRSRICRAKSSPWAQRWCSSPKAPKVLAPSPPASIALSPRKRSWWPIPWGPVTRSTPGPWPPFTRPAP